MFSNDFLKISIRTSIFIHLDTIIHSSILVDKIKRKNFIKISIHSNIKILGRYKKIRARNNFFTQILFILVIHK